MKTKICKMCKKEKSADEYSPHPHTKDKLAIRCKPCANEWGRAYRRKNAEKVRAEEKIRNQTPERKEQRRQWEILNRDKRRAQERANDAANREEKNRKQKEWRDKNTEKEKAHTLKWREKNRDSIREKSRIQSIEYRKANPDKVVAATHRYRKRVKENGGTFNGEEWTAIKTRYDFTCLCCGKKEPDIKLSPDHVIPISKGGANDASNIQPLCRKCNRIKSDTSVDYRIAGYAVNIEKALRDSVQEETA